jgi:2-polyprenyl-3-methyl-5-hydroxy-6-metoxy-1,4-benzoquinol methylase
MTTPGCRVTRRCIPGGYVIQKADTVDQSAIYDKVYTAGGYDGVYHLPYWRSNYYPLLRTVLREIRHQRVARVLEVGCGTGWFAQMIFDYTGCEYHGFDFSEVAVQTARRTTGRPDQFAVADALEPDTYNVPYDSVVCTEVLEHIREDQRAVSLWRPGVRVVASLPNFDADTHERFFRTEQEIVSRYEKWITFEWIKRVKRPLLGDIGWRNRLRHLAWSRYQPREILRLLGLTNFDTDAGWFVFSGLRSATA